MFRQRNKKGTARAVKVKDMMKWRKVDKKTDETAKRNCNSFEPHDYIGEDENGFKLRIINNSFHEAKGGWVLVTFRRKYEIAKFDRLKDAKAYAETL